MQSKVTPNVFVTKPHKTLWRIQPQLTSITRNSGTVGLPNFNCVTNMSLAKANQFVEHFSANGNTVPRQGDTSSCFSDGTIMGKWWKYACKPDGCIATNHDVQAIIQACAPLWDIYEAMCEARTEAHHHMVT